METPLIIAACNEADYIDRALASLSKRQVAPIVVVNASQDDTAKIAHNYGATVLETDQPGKLPALQTAVRYLGKTAALDPILFTDADSYPLLPNRWPCLLTESLADDHPGVVTGPVAYYDGKMCDRLFNTYRLGRSALSARLTNATFSMGSNMAIKLNTPAILEEFLAMPHIWRGDDAAITKMIHQNGGTCRQLITPASCVLTSTRYAITLKERLTLGPQEAWQAHLERYKNRAPAGSRSFRPKSKLGY